MDDLEESLVKRVDAYRRFRCIPHYDGRDEVHATVRIVQKALGETVKDIFVGDTNNENGNSKTMELWMFSDHYLVRTNTVSAGEGFSIFLLASNVREVNILPADYELFDNYGCDNSALVVRLTVSHGAVLELRARKVNCAVLSEITKQYLIRNMLMS